MPQRVPAAGHSDMQLPGKLLLSAAALLLLSLAFRFYRNRSPPPGKIPPGEPRENRDGDGGVRRRREGRHKSGNGLGMRHAALRGERSFPRSEEEEGEEVGSELELIPRKAPLGSGTERELGRKVGWKLGIESESEARVGLGSDPGRRTGSEPGKELGRERGKEPGKELGKELGSESGKEPGKKLGRELGREPGREPGSELGSELGSQPGCKSGSRLGIKPGNNPGRKSGSEPGSKVVRKPGNESGSEQGIEPGNKLGIKSGTELGSEQGGEPGRKLGIEPGILLGSEQGSHDPGAVAGARSSPAERDAPAPSSGRSPGIRGARTEGDGCAQGAERDSAGAGRSRAGSSGSVRTLSVTSNLGLLLTASEAGSDTSYRFSSVAKIQVEENFIPERRDKDGDNRAGPGLRGKVYDYFVQSTSESVSRRTSLPFVPAGRAQRRGERGQAEPQSSGTQRENPAPEIPDPDSSTAPQPGTESPPEPQPGTESPPESQPGTEGPPEPQPGEESPPEPQPGEESPPEPQPGTEGPPEPQPGTEVPPEPQPGTKGPPEPQPGTGSPPEPQPGTEGPPEPQPGTKGPPEPQPGTEGPPEPQPGTESPPEPQPGEESPPEPPSPAWRDSTLGIAPQLPGEVPAAAPELSQVSPPAQVHLGNCSEVLRSAKARQLRALQDAALRVMSEHLLQVLRSPAIYGRLNAGERELLPALRSRGRPRLVVADVPPAEPGQRRGRLCYYDEDGDRWCQLCQLPAGVSGRGCAVCPMFNYLFVAPGWEGAGRARSPSRRVLCYDPLNDSWSDICPLRQARPRCRLVALDGHLYAIGGECLATVERYDPRRDRWAAAAALPRDTFAVAHAAAACGGDIFVTGGTLRSLLLRYDARRDSWATSPAAGDEDRTAELVSAHGFLYRFQVRRGAGGGTDVTVSRRSASAGLWYRCASRALPEPAGLRCAALGGLVHCLGRDSHLRFLADPVSPRFGARELRPFPAPHGSLLPAVLALPEAGTEPPRL